MILLAQILGSIALFVWLIKWFKRNNKSMLAGVVTALVFCLVLLLAPYYWGILDFPRFISRDFVVERDYRTMEKLLGKPLPESLVIREVRFQANNFIPSPDGPLPTPYQLDLHTDDWPGLLARLSPVAWTGAHLDPFTLELIKEQFDEVHDVDSFFTRAMLSKSKSVMIKLEHEQIRSYLYLDDSTSPHLKLYALTQLSHLD